MSATTTQGLAPDQDLDVVDYVARVRRALDDLDAEVVGELTLGMEADLAEIRAEAGSLVERLGVPERCADELRAAADLPPRAAVAPRARGCGGPRPGSRQDASAPGVTGSAPSSIIPGCGRARTTCARCGRRGGCYGGSSRSGSSGPG